MNKQEFITSLRRRLVGLSEVELDARADFYSEMIDDRVEEGATEEEAVAAIGPLDDVVREILSQIPLSHLVKEKVKPKRRLSGVEILLLVLGAPLWISLLAAGFAVVVAIVASIFSVIVSLWAAGASLVACGVGGLSAGLLMVVLGNGYAGVGLIGAALVCAGGAIYVLYLGKAVTKGAAWVIKKGILAIKCCFLKGGRDHA